MLEKFVPLKLHLHILQLEGYKARRFIKWVFRNYFVRSVENKKPLVYTSKAKFLMRVSILYMVLALLFLLYFGSIVGFIVWILLITQPYIFLLTSLVTRMPYEYLNRVLVKRNVKAKILRLKSKGLIVIGITGSFGKTTTKEFLYKILKTEFKVLKTPDSYNTLFGIYKVVDLELSDSYDIFICEMGAYKRGEIKELCDVVLPDHAILTGINEQHLERFGSIKNTIRAKFELIKAVDKNCKESLKLLNIDNQNVKQNYLKFTDNAILYGGIPPKNVKENVQSDKSLYQNNNRPSQNFTYNYYENMKYSNGKLSVDFIVDGKKFAFQNLTIAGLGNVSNLLASTIMAKKLGVSYANIRDAVKNLKPVSHRLEVKYLKDKVLIDDSYSSNVSGFKVALDLLKSFNKNTRIIVTPGIVELGNRTIEIHKELSELVNKVCDVVILVGKNEKTNALANKVDRKKINYINSIKNLNSTLEKLGLKNPVILIENDLPENY